MRLVAVQSATHNTTYIVEEPMSNNLLAIQQGLELHDGGMASLVSDRTGGPVSVAEWRDAVTADTAPEGWEAVLQNTPESAVAPHRTAPDEDEESDEESDADGDAPAA
jgi:hypothetical protein